jgi:hypothetical protein
VKLRFSCGSKFKRADFTGDSPEEYLFFALTLRLPTAFFHVMGKFFRKVANGCMLADTLISPRPFELASIQVRFRPKMNGKSLKLAAEYLPI